MALSYQDVRSERIDVDAQRSLMRMSARPETAADAVAMAGAVRSGRLFGIFAEDQKEPALRAKKQGRGWWELIPKGEGATVVGDAANVFAAPLIAFRDSLRKTPAALDAALIRTGRLLLRTTGCRVDTVTFWLRTFVPQTIPGVTRVITEGPHADGRKTAIQDTTPRNCLLTDQRGFSAAENAPSRTASKVVLTIPQTVTGTASIREQTHRVGEAIGIDCTTGVQFCRRTFPPFRMSFFNVRHQPLNGGQRVDLSVEILARTMCVGADFTTRVTGGFTLFIPLSPPLVGVQCALSVRAFAVEIYAAANACAPVALVRQNIANQTLAAIDRGRLVSAGETFRGLQCNPCTTD